MDIREQTEELIRRLRKPVVSAGNYDEDQVADRLERLLAVYEAACLVHDLTGYSLMENTVIPAPQDVHIKLDEAIDAVQTRLADCEHDWEYWGHPAIEPQCKLCGYVRGAPDPERRET